MILFHISYVLLLFLLHVSFSGEISSPIVLLLYCTIKSYYYHSQTIPERYFSYFIRALTALYSVGMCEV